MTALYEVVPRGKEELPGVAPLKYQSKSVVEISRGGIGTELLTVKLRFKVAGTDKAMVREFPLTDGGLAWQRCSPDFRFASAVASFGLLLRESPYRGSSTWELTRQLAVNARGDDSNGQRAEFLALVEMAKSLVR